MSNLHNWIERAITKPGRFSAKAKKAGMTTAAYARFVLANPQKYDETTLREARLAQTLAKLRPKK